MISAALLGGGCCVLPSQPPVAAVAEKSPMKGVPVLNSSACFISSSLQKYPKPLSLNPKQPLAKNRARPFQMPWAVRPVCSDGVISEAPFAPVP